MRIRSEGFRPTALLLAILISLTSLCHAMGVVGIDYGTESMKVSLVKPGQPFDVVLSRDSKRKIPSAISWKLQERLYGTDAVNLATRYPGDTFLGAKFLLGRSIDDVKAKARQETLLGTKLLPAKHRNDTTIALERGTDYTINKEGADVYSVEEVVGMQLSHAKMLAEEQAGEEVMRTFPGTIGSFGGLDVVVTVPIFFTAAERQSILDAASVAGMKAKLVSDGAAGE
jgi:hypoxia up-regulated 1